MKLKFSGGMKMMRKRNYNQFPKQSDALGKEVLVCSKKDKDMLHTVKGTIVRDDAERPYETIIRLENDRFVTGREVFYSFWIPAGKAVEV